MKKNLIALAALTAIAGVAQAQSSVTLYGVADAFVGQRTITNAAGAKTTNGVIDSNGMSTSRFGFRGTEDLGGGLKAIFTMEAGLLIDTGAGNNNGGGLFSRQAFVGLNGGFGTVTLGRQYTAYDALRALTNNTFDTASFTTTGAVWNSGVRDYASRASNSFAYTSPNFNGISGAFVVGVGEDKIPGAGPVPASKASHNLSMHIKYANGPLVVGYAHQNEKFNVGTIISSLTPLGGVPTGTVKYNYFGGSYDLGVAKLVGGYNTAKQRVGGARDKEFQFGVEAPIGPIALAAGYARSKTDNSAVKATGASLIGTYSLSKRTNVYAGFAESKQTLVAGTTRNRLIATGVRHRF